MAKLYIDASNQKVDLFKLIEFPLFNGDNGNSIWNIKDFRICIDQLVMNFNVETLKYDHSQV